MVHFFWVSYCYSWKVTKCLPLNFFHTPKTNHWKLNLKEFFSSLITSRTLKLNLTKSASLPDSSHTHTSIHPRAFIALWLFSLTLHSKAWHDFKLRKPESTQIQSNEALNVFVNCKNAFLVLFISQKQSAMKVRSFFFGNFLLEITNIIIKSLKSFYHQLELSEIKKSVLLPFIPISYQKKEKNIKIKFSGCSFFLKVSSESIKHSKKLLEA